MSLYEFCFLEREENNLQNFWRSLKIMFQCTFKLSRARERQYSEHRHFFLFLFLTEIICVVLPSKLISLPCTSSVTAGVDWVVPTPAWKDSGKKSQFKQKPLISRRASPRFASRGDISALKNSRNYSKTEIFVVWCTVRILSPESYLFSLYI